VIRSHTFVHVIF